MTVAVLDGGTYYHHEVIHGPRFRERFDRAIYAPELAAEQLREISALIVADRINPGVLRAKRRLLLDFLAGDGTLIVLGENEAHSWAPGVEWTFKPTNFWWWLEKGTDPGHRVVAPEHELFGFIEPRDVVWHFHGLLHPPRGATPLVTIAPEYGGGENGAILYEQRGLVDGRGRMLVATLDPFYHSGSFFMPAAARFLGGLLDWTDATFRGVRRERTP